MNKLLVLLLVFSVPGFAEVYKRTVNGKTVYTDKPGKGARKVDLPPITNYRHVSPGRVRVVQPKKVKSGIIYNLEVVSPANDVTLFDVEGKVTLQFSLRPSLASHLGHKIEYSFSNISGKTGSAKYVARNVDRGTHNITARVVDRQGNVMSNVVRQVFHLKRPSAQIRKNLKKNKFLAP